MQRIFVIVLDSAGVGALPDAEQYGDVGSNTIGNLAGFFGHLNLPNLEKLGLGQLVDLSPDYTEKKCSILTGSFGKMAEVSAGKDTLTGHWEMAGIILDEPFPVYPQGFPPEIIKQFSQAIGRQILGNYPASGTEIINQLGKKHQQTGFPIVYTSADSVFQIAAHEEIIPVPKLYEFCQKARQILTGKHGVGRVIARPFLGKPGNFFRTRYRKDFGLFPPSLTLLDYLQKNKIEVVGIGKIGDIFNYRGVDKVLKTKNNQEGISLTLDEIISSSSQQKFIFTNLIDFDMVYGHRNDCSGYRTSLEEFDFALAEILAKLTEDDLLFIVADHGCDPTTAGTDHSREYVPLLVHGKKLKSGVDLGIRDSFADLGQTIAELFQIEPLSNGKSFKKEIL
ncbi:MAG: phosphopentomutase [Elusimicrobiota bacterium]